MANLRSATVVNVNTSVPSSSWIYSALNKVIGPSFYDVLSYFPEVPDEACGDERLSDRPSLGLACLNMALGISGEEFFRVGDQRQRTFRSNAGDIAARTSR